MVWGPKEGRELSQCGLFAGAKQPSGVVPPGCISLFPSVKGGDGSTVTSEVPSGPDLPAVILWSPHPSGLPSRMGHTPL